MQLTHYLPKLLSRSLTLSLRDLTTYTAHGYVMLHNQHAHFINCQLELLGTSRSTSARSESRP